jgi:hypothetical protein
LSQKTAESNHHERLVRLAREAYRDVVRVRAGESAPEVEARFYPYAGLRSTVRMRDGRIFLRISDLLRDAPDDAVGALARILIAKLLRRRVRAEWNDAYRAHVAQAEVMEAAEGLRRERGSKRLAAPRGRAFDLEPIFDRLNAKYFAGMLERPRLGWTLKDSWRTHGHYDAAHRVIVLSRTLDDPATPPFVVEFVLYHEMLHAFMPSEVRDGRHRHHTPEFRAAESRFPYMREAVAWLEKLSTSNGTGKRKRRLRRRG